MINLKRFAILSYERDAYRVPPYPNKASDSCFPGQHDTDF